MLEKLLLAATLTYSLSVFAVKSWSTPTQTTSDTNRHQLVLYLSERQN